MAIRLAIDIGSNYITIFSKGQGVVLKEPSIAIVRKTSKKLHLIASGSKALKMQGRLDPEDYTVHPVSEGITGNTEAAYLMLKDYIGKVSAGTILKHRIEVIALISCGLNVGERRDIETVLTRAGANQVNLIETPVAVFQQGNKDYALVIIIGADVTEVAIVSDDGIICGCTVDIAGEAMNRAIVEYIGAKYKVQIGAYAAERIKVAIGSMYNNDMSTAEVNGKDLNENSPKLIEITASDVRKAITPLLDKIVEVIDSVMCSCPDNIIEDVYANGIFFAGGSSQMPGLAEYIAASCKMKPIIVDDPSNAVANGGGALLNDNNSLSRFLNNTKN